MLLKVSKLVNNEKCDENVLYNIYKYITTH